MEIFNKLHEKIVHGLHFTPSSVEEAMRENKMLVLDMDFTTDCNLNCYYCDRSNDRSNENEKRITTLEERKSFISQAKELGAWAVGIVGAGEPMLDQDFWELINYMVSLNMVPLVYASGSEIYNKDIAKKLMDSGCSIMLKYSIEDEDKSDKVVGKKGHTRRMKDSLNWLVEAGLNSTNPTRLGINIVLTKKNQEEKEKFYDMYRWCRDNNVYLHGQSLIPKGKGNNEKLLMEKMDAVEILNKTSEIDRNEYQLDYNIVPPITCGYRCRKINVGMFVNAFGEVWDCNGSRIKLGNIRENSLKEIWNTEKAKKVRNELQEGYCPLREHVWEKKEYELQTV